MSGVGASGEEGVSEVKLIPCENCGKGSSQCCGNCGKEYFCSVICQKARRKQHKLICFPVKEEIGVPLRSSPGENTRKEFWVATRDIKEGEKIFTDYPLMTGPGVQVFVHGRHICLGCHKILDNFYPRIDERRCGDCRWPFCGDACPERDRHLKECETLCRMGRNDRKKEFIDAVACARDGVDTVYEPIRVVRILAVVKDDPIKLQSFLNLHVPDRVQNPENHYSGSFLENYMNAAAVKLYKSVCQVDHLSDETILKLMSVESNHRSLPFYRRKDKAEMLIYDKATRLDVSCIENCYITQIPMSKKLEDPHGIVIAAAKVIKKGDRLSITYGGTLAGTFAGSSKWDGTKRRRESLKIGFICKCTRCSDPTEFETNVSAIKCTKCNSGLLLPLDALDDKSKWKCNTAECKGLFPASDVDKIVNKIQEEADALPPTTSVEKKDSVLMGRVGKFVQKYEKILNPHHYILLNAQELILTECSVCTHQATTPDRHFLFNDGLSKAIDVHRGIAELFLQVGTKIFPTLNHNLLEAHFYVALSKFFSAQQAIRNKENMDVVQDWLKQGISHRRHVMEIGIKMPSPLPLEDRRGDEISMMTHFSGEAYDNALELCRLTPDYRGIPEKMLEFDNNLCTAAVPTPTVEEN